MGKTMVIAVQISVQLASDQIPLHRGVIFLDGRMTLTSTRYDGRENMSRSRSSTGASKRNQNTLDISRKNTSKNDACDQHYQMWVTCCHCALPNEYLANSQNADVECNAAMYATDPHTQRINH